MLLFFNFQYLLVFVTSSSSSLCLLPHLPDIILYYVHFIMCLTFDTAHTPFLPLATEQEREKQKYFLIGPPPKPPHLPAITFVTKTEGRLIRDLIRIWFMMKGTSENLQLPSKMEEVLPSNWFSSSILPWTVIACSYSPEISFFLSYYSEEHALGSCRMAVQSGRVSLFHSYMVFSTHYYTYHQYLSQFLTFKW